MNSDTLSSEATDSASPDPHESYKKDLHTKSTKAVYAALIANLGIFLVKFIFGLLGRSSAMISESFHSFADSFNSICLIVGLKRGNKPADNQHHFGYGLEASAWTLVASMVMFCMAILSVGLAFYRLFHSQSAEDLYEHFYLISTALVISAFFELWAINNASKAVLAEFKFQLTNPVSNFLLSLKHINKVKSPTTKFVWYEDTAAFCGVVIALISITIARYITPEHYAYVPDAVASLIIGIILICLAVFLFKNYLVSLGAAARPQVEKVIKEVTNGISGISEVYELKTMDLGSSGLIVNMEIEVDPEIPVKDVDDITEKIEEKLKHRLPNISHVNIEVQADETEDNWAERFNALIEEGIKENIITHREAKIMENFYDFTDTTVSEVMIPRTEINCLENTCNINDLINLVVETGHTRIPIYQESVDNIIGLIHAKDLFKIYHDGNTDIDVTELVREIPRVPENKPVSTMLNELISEKNQMALVADEHGGIAGLVTIEDLMEEIFGEIWDEYDVEIIERKQLDKNTVLLSSKLNIEEINERYDLDIPTEEFNTIGGYVFGQLGRVPAINDTIELGEWLFTVDSMEGHKMLNVRLYNPNGIIDRIEEEERKQIEEENNSNNNHKH